MRFPLIVLLCNRPACYISYAENSTEKQPWSAGSRARGSPDTAWVPFWAYSFAGATITNYYGVGGLNNIYFLTFLEPRSLRSRYWQGWFLQSCFSLTCRWLFSP